MNRLLFLSCEHASRAIPRNLSFYFQNSEAQRLLPTHRGYDIGAAEVFRRLAQILQPTYATEGSYSRLAIDLNRNSNKNHRYSAFTSSISPEAKNFLENYFDNYRNAFWEAASRELQKQNDTQILHLSIHSFTPVLNGVERNADFGLLYDPSRKTESAFAASMKNHRRMAHPIQLSLSRKNGRPHNRPAEVLASRKIHRHRIGNEPSAFSTF